MEKSDVNVRNEETEWDRDESSYDMRLQGMNLPVNARESHDRDMLLPNCKTYFIRNHSSLVYLPIVKARWSFSWCRRNPDKKMKPLSRRKAPFWDQALPLPGVLNITCQWSRRSSRWGSRVKKYLYPMTCGLPQLHAKGSISAAARLINARWGPAMPSRTYSSQCSLILPPPP